MEDHAITPEELEEAIHDPEVRLALRHELWLQGDLSGELRPDGQWRIYQFVKEIHAREPTPLPFIIETHRRLGKSHFGFVVAAERALEKPGQRGIYGAPTEKQAEQIVVPNAARVLETCPPEAYPEKTKHRWTFWNPRWPPGSQPSVVELIGINQNPDAARGSGCDFAVIDEAGYVKPLEYFVDEVLSWQFVGRDRPLFLMLSTPPRTPDHPFIRRFWHQAEARGRRLTIRLSENSDVTEEDRRIVRQITGGEKTIGWQREAECEHVTDPEAMVVPEWQVAREECLVEHPRPRYFLPEVLGDLGFKDKTHILFGYVDFEAQFYVVEYEKWLSHPSVGDVARACHETEPAIWLPEEVPLVEKTRRIFDCDPQKLYSLWKDHKLQAASAQKHDREATLAALRGAIQQRKVRIHPRCKHLDEQLTYGVYNENRTDFERSDNLGHLDGVMALAYGLRQARWRKNPFPPQVVDWDTEHVKRVRRPPTREEPWIARAFR